MSSVGDKPVKEDATVVSEDGSIEEVAVSARNSCHHIYVWCGLGLLLAGLLSLIALKNHDHVKEISGPFLEDDEPIIFNFELIETFSPVHAMSLFYRGDGAWDQAAFIDDQGCVNVIDYADGETFMPLCNTYIDDVTALNIMAKDVVVAQNGVVSVWRADEVSGAFKPYPQGSNTISNSDAAGFGNKVLRLVVHDGPASIMVAADESIFHYGYGENGWTMLRSWKANGFDVNEDYSFMVIYDDTTVRVFNLADEWYSDSYEPILQTSAAGIVSAAITEDGEVNVVTQAYEGITVTNLVSGHSKEFNMFLQVFGDVIVSGVSGQIYSVRSHAYLSIKVEGTDGEILDVKATPSRVAVLTTRNNIPVADIYEN